MDPLPLGPSRDPREWGPDTGPITHNNNIFNINTINYNKNNNNICNIIIFVTQIILFLILIFLIIMKIIIFITQIIIFRNSRL
jgi:hypothetical protein